VTHTRAIDQGIRLPRRYLDTIATFIIADALVRIFRHEQSWNESWPETGWPRVNIASTARAIHNETRM
jgi:hypothetical protein